LVLSVTVAIRLPSRNTWKFVPVSPVALCPVTSRLNSRQLRKTPSLVPATTSPRSASGRGEATAAAGVASRVNVVVTARIDRTASPPGWWMS
jgi:hypothetical protein